MKSPIARLAIASMAVLMCTTAVAQPGEYAWARMDVPNPLIMVIHPTLPAKIYMYDGPEVSSIVDVRVGYASWDGDGCGWGWPLPEADAVMIRLDEEDVDSALFLDTPLPLIQPADDDGWSTIDLSNLRGGGFSWDPGIVWTYVPDRPACFRQNESFIYVRSPDFNGDLTVNLSDIVTFTVFFGQHAPFADLHVDGEFTLSDIAVMSAGILEQ